MTRLEADDGTHVARAECVWWFLIRQPPQSDNSMTSVLRYSRGKVMSVASKLLNEASDFLNEQCGHATGSEAVMRANHNSALQCVVCARIGRGIWGYTAVARAFECAP